MRAEQLVDVERVADGQRRAIHDLQIAAGARPARDCRPRRRQTGGCPARWLTDLTIREPSTSPAPTISTSCASGCFAALVGIGEEQQRAADLDAVAVGQPPLA